MSDKPVIEVLEDDSKGSGPDFSEPAYDAGDKEHVDQAKRRAGRVAKEKGDYLASMMATREGRRWIYWLLEAAHVYRISFVPGDPSNTAFNEGARSVGLLLRTEILRAAPTQYTTMIEEAHKK